MISPLNLEKHDFLGLALLCYHARLEDGNLTPEDDKKLALTFAKFHQQTNDFLAYVRDSLPIQHPTP